MEKVKSKKVYYFYTIIFCILFFCCYGVFFIKYHKSFIWNQDGLDQHFTSFLYLGRYIRTFLKNLFAKHTLAIPRWDYTMGFGSDIYITLGTIFYDPLNWTSAFFPESISEYGFDFLVILKFYFTGFTFLLFCRSREKEDWASLCGALLYTFSACMYIGFIHADFINIFYIFPIVFIGIDRLWGKKISIWYIISIFLLFLNHFYFGYMASICIAGYCVLRFVFGCSKNIKRFFLILIKYLINSLLGISMSMVAILPVIKNLATTGRMKLDYYLPTFYSVDFYKSFFKGQIDVLDTGNDSFFGFGAFFPIILFVGIAFFREYKITVISLLLLLAGYCIPFFGHIMNGFSYASNRWVFAIAFAFSYLAVDAMTALRRMKKKQKMLISILLIIYTLVAALWIGIDSKKYDSALALMWIIWLLILLFVNNTPYNHLKIKKITIVALTGMTVFRTAFFFWNPRYYGAWLNNMIDAGSARNLIAYNGNSRIIQHLDKRKFVRYDFKGLDSVLNSSWSNGKQICSYDFYEPYYNDNIHKYYQSLGLNAPFSILYRGLDNRTVLEHLNGTKYYAVNKDNYENIPYGFDKLCQGGSYNNREIVIAKNNSASLAYTFSRSVRQQEYLRTLLIDRQNILTQACVLSDSKKVNADISKCEKINSYSIPFNIDKSSKVKFDDNTFYVKEPNDQLILDINKCYEGEWYLQFSNLQNVGDINKYYTITAQASKNGIMIPGTFSPFTGVTYKAPTYGGKHDWLIKIGNVKQADKIILTFQNPGKYSVDDFQPYILKKTDAEYLLSKLTPADAKIKLKCNQIDIDARISDSGKYLYLAIPYSDGWSATVNGKKTKILKADEAFMALKMKPGDYKIVLRYQTPGFKLGAIISTASWVIVIGLIIYKRKTAKSKIPTRQ